MQINLYQFLVTDSILLVASLLLAVYLLVQKERNLFEIRIVGCMSISYLIWVPDHFDFMFNGSKIAKYMGYNLHCFFFALASCLHNFAYWTYATQYMKTCKILPYLLERAKVLLQQYNEKLENEFDLSKIPDNFMAKHDEMDYQLGLIK